MKLSTEVDKNIHKYKNIFNNFKITNYLQTKSKVYSKTFFIENKLKAHYLQMQICILVIQGWTLSFHQVLTSGFLSWQLPNVRFSWIGSGRRHSGQNITPQTSVLDHLMEKKNINLNSMQILKQEYFYKAICSTTNFIIS